MVGSFVRIYSVWPNHYPPFTCTSPTTPRPPPPTEQLEQQLTRIRRKGYDGVALALKSIPSGDRELFADAIHGIGLQYVIASLPWFHNGAKRIDLRLCAFSHPAIRCWVKSTSRIQYKARLESSMKGFATFHL